jgi:uncharacterized membrane protein YbhN (UPF0104 family)
MTEPAKATDARASTRPALARLWRIAGVIAVAAIMLLVIRQLIRGWPAVKAYPWQWNFAYLFASFAVMQVGYMVMARTWRSVLRAIDVRPSYHTAYWIFYISNLGRYLPGKVWQIGAAAMFGKRLGFSGHDMASSMIMHLLYFLPVGSVLALSWGTIPAPYDQPALQALAWGLSLAALAAAIWPHLLLKAVPPLARFLKVDPDRWKLALSRRAAIVAQSCFAWLCLSVGFALFVLSVMPLGVESGPDLARAYIASHLIGYLVLFAPGGLGVREGAITVLLSPMLGAAPAAGIALLSRLWVTVTELIAIIPAIIWARRDRRS